MKKHYTILALCILCLAGCKTSQSFIIEDGPMNDPECVTMQIKNIPLTVVLEVFFPPSQRWGFPEEYDDMYVTASFTNTPWKEALSKVLSPHDLMLKESPPGSKVYRIAKRKEK